MRHNPAGSEIVDQGDIEGIIGDELRDKRCDSAFRGAARQGAAADVEIDLVQLVLAPRGQKQVFPSAVKHRPVAKGRHRDLRNKAVFDDGINSAQVRAGSSKVNYRYGPRIKPQVEVRGDDNEVVSIWVQRKTGGKDRPVGGRWIASEAASHQSSHANDANTLEITAHEQALTSSDADDNDVDNAAALFSAAAPAGSQTEKRPRIRA